MDAFESGATLCAPFLQHLPVAGVSISMVSGAGVQSTVGTSDLIAARLEELQFQLGEGPTADTLRTGRPVLVPDLADARLSEGWPIFAPAAQETGARALFSFPISLGSITVGVVSLYALSLREPWTEVLLQSTAALAAAAALPAVELATRSADAEREPGRQQTELRREVHQAAGMVSVQLDCSIAEAMTRLRARAFTEGRSVDAIARAVVARALDLGTADD